LEANISETVHDTGLVSMGHPRCGYYGHVTDDVT